MSAKSCSIFTKVMNRCQPFLHLLAHVSKNYFIANTIFDFPDIISKFNKNNVVFEQARKMHALPISKTQGDAKRKAQMEAESKKLMNVMFHNGAYYVHEPFPDKQHKRDPDLIIEKHCWLVVKYLQKMRAPIKMGDVVRFGRVTFKVTELVITKRDI